MTNTDTIRVLFVCVHNAARSRMAEALLRELGGDAFDVESAGFEPHAMDAVAVEALAQIGLTVPSVAPQPSVFDLVKAGRYFNYIIAVCDAESGQRCPFFPGVTQRLNWSFTDPATFTGSAEERLAQVAEVRDAIRAKLVAWLATLPRAPSRRQPTHFDASNRN